MTVIAFYNKLNFLIKFTLVQPINVVPNFDNFYVVVYGCGEIDKYEEKSEINGRLVCYCSDQAHSSVEKSALVAITRIRLLPTDENHRLRGETLRDAIEKDKQNGLIPFFVCATLGTTGVCAFDALDEIGPICADLKVWHSLYYIK